jgi:hypothetical protein
MVARENSKFYVKDLEGKAKNSSKGFDGVVMIRASKLSRVQLKRQSVPWV